MIYDDEKYFFRDSKLKKTLFNTYFIPGNVELYQYKPVFFEIFLEFSLKQAVEKNKVFMDFSFKMAGGMDKIFDLGLTGPKKIEQDR